MEFCDICFNMIYIKSSGCGDKYGNDKDKEITGYSPKLIKFCKHCKFEKEENTNASIKVSETIYTEDDLLYNQQINQYLRFDPSLRRIKDDNITMFAIIVVLLGEKIKNDIYKEDLEN
jgi:hypothetical protein